MEKTEVDLPANAEEVKIKNKEDNSTSDRAEGDGEDKGVKDKDGDRDIDTSGLDGSKQGSSSDKGATSKQDPESIENQHRNAESEDMAAEKPAVEDVVNNERENLETQPDRSESELNVDWSQEPALDNDGRNQMFEEGLKLDKDGKKLEALKCYLKCLVGLKENTRFALLPQCLRNIGDIYYGRDEFDKAISFIQAEKLYYESVLIDDTELQKHIDEVTVQGASDIASTDIDALRATEYEQLAKLCLEEKQPQLALEYAGKCTKLRQKVFGDNHPLVQQSLDFFATVYAEVGKVKYTDPMNVTETISNQYGSLSQTLCGRTVLVFSLGESMSKYKEAGEPDITSPTVAWETTPSEPTSILRRRKTVESDREKKVRFDESQVPSEETNEQEEQCARFVLLCFFFVLVVVLVFLGVYLLCNYESPSTCKNIRYAFSDTVMQVKYWYYRFWSSTNSKYT